MKEKFKLYGSIFILVIFVPFLLMLWVEGGFGGRQADPVQQQIEEALPFVVAKEVSVGSNTESAGSHCQNEPLGNVSEKSE